MYDRETWGGPVDPFISVTFPEVTDDADAQPIVSLLIFEWKDYDLIGRYPTPEAVEVRRPLADPGLTPAYLLTSPRSPIIFATHELLNWASVPRPTPENGSPSPKP